MPRESFSKVLPTLQTAWDSTSLNSFKRCPRYYKQSIVDGWTKGRQNLHLRFGILYHRAGEVYDHKIAEGLSHDDALDFALVDLAEGCMDTLPDGTRKWWDPAEDLNPKQAQANTKTVETLFRSVIWYADRFGAESDDRLHTVILPNGKPAVELSFRFVDPTFEFHTGEALILSGHLDRVVEYNGAEYIVDKKTTKNTLDGYSGTEYFKDFSPNGQMSGYTFAGMTAFARKVRGVIIDAVQIAKGFSRFVRGFTTRTPEQIEEWRQDAHYWIRQAEACAVNDYWPMNDSACSHYSGCVFRDICSKSPSVRGAYLRSDFTQGEGWDPLKVRGDI